MPKRIKYSPLIVLILLAVVVLLLWHSQPAVAGQNGLDPAQTTADADPLALLESGQAEESDTGNPSVPSGSGEEVSPAEDGDAAASESATLAEDGSYTSKEDVCAYLIAYGHLPSNFISKKEAQAAGWEGGSLEPYCPGKCIGGDRFSNYEGHLPSAKGRTWTECDIDTLGARSRGAKRIVFSNDGLIYYTGDHYESFELLYGEP